MQLPGPPPLVYGADYDMQQLSVCQEEIFLKKCGSGRLDMENIKVEQEEFWSSQEEQQLHQLEESGIIKFPLTLVPVKSENEEKPALSQLYQILSDESAQADSPVRSSFEHRTLTAQAHGEDNRRPGPDSNLGPYTDGKNSDISETETDDSFEWYPTLKICSGLNRLQNGDICVSSAQKQLDDSESGKAFFNKIYSNQHKSETPVGCLDHGKKWRQNVNEKTHPTSHTGEKPFGCSECDKTFGQKTHLKAHMRIHTGEKPFVCSECSKTFGLKSQLDGHKRIHTGEKPFDCSECGKTFGQKGHLKVHMRIHTREKPFVCSECGKTFGLKNHLDVHMRIHTGEKPFTCSDCGKRFGRKGVLNVHKRTHTGEKPYACFDCGERFGRRDNLNAHIRIHTGEKPFGCSECGKCFRQKSSFNMHMKRHRGQYLFGCPECAETFRSKGKLNKHMRSHKEEKLHGCSECGKKFRRQHNLTRHMKIHTGEKDLSRASESSPDATRTRTLSRARAPLSGRTHSRAPCPSQRSENSLRGSRQLLGDRLRRRTGCLAAPFSATPDSVPRP